MKITYALVPLILQVLLGGFALTGLVGCGADTEDLPQVTAAETSRQDAAVITRDNGAPCEDSEVCESGYCVDGVCCATACTGTCMACNETLTGTSSGVCLAVTVDTDPDNECEPDGDICGLDGFCSGVLAPSGEASTCGFVNTDVQCLGERCIDADIYGAANCNGAGSCGGSSVTEECGLYACQEGADGPGCPTTCSSDAECDGAAGAWCCESTGQCVTGKAPGQTCSSAGECGCGFCVDGVCCGTACTGSCYSCNQAYTGGVASGECAPVAAGLNWSDCTAQATATCGLNGKCDGSGACQLYNNTTECGASGCSGGDAVGPQYCSGDGSCQPGTLADECNEYACESGACRTNCFDDGDCASGYRCYLNRLGGGNTCTDKLLIGEACSQDSQCASGECVDGYCCESGCEATCEACRKSKTGENNGWCEPVSEGTDPDLECAPASCIDSDRFSVPRATCDSGQCSNPAGVACSPYRCNGATGNCFNSCPSYLNGEVHENCGVDTPYCIYGGCYDNRRPSANSVNASADQSSTTNIELSGSDPDGDSLYFELVGTPSNAVILSQNGTNATVRFTATSCYYSENFRYRVCDRESGDPARLCSSNARVIVSIQNVRPWVSINTSNGVVSHNQDLSRSFSFGDACTPNADLYVVARRDGAGSVNVTNRNNAAGTATVNWISSKSTPALWCDGPYSQHLRQDATVIVQNSDNDATGSAQFNATALPASECSDECTLDILWCQVDEILPSNCAYCRDYYRSERYCCARHWWGGCKRNCTRQVRENTCDDVSSTLGVLTVIGNWFQSVGCTITFGLIPCPDPPRCWWD